MMMVNFASTLFLLSLAQCALVVQGWGKDGHELVGNIAYRLLSATSQSAVKQILFNHTSPSSDNTPLGAVADWADQVRISKAYHWSGALHYIDIHDELVSGGCPAATNKSGCHFQYPRDCKDDVCVAGAIVNYTKHLADWNKPQQQAQKQMLRTKTSRRLEGSTYLLTPYRWWPSYAKEITSPLPTQLVQESLMFLTHFVGDIHQPLHSARQSDRGGNSISVTFEVPSTKVSKLFHHHHLELHAVWDTSIIERAIHTIYQHSRPALEDEMMDYIQKAHQTGDTKKWLSCPDTTSYNCTTLWAEESWQHALNWAYLDADGHSEITSGTHLSDEYFETRWPQIYLYLAVAGVRLAAALELVLGTTTTTTTNIGGVL